VKILFMPHNAYHTRNMALSVPSLKNAGADCLFVNIEGSYHSEGAEQQMKDLGLDYVEYDRLVIHREKPDVLAVMNDWGGVVKAEILRANCWGIPTAAIVEGVQDFENTHLATTGKGPRRGRPYARARYFLLTGEYDRKFVTTDRATVVGIPRIEHLCREEPVFPKTPLAAINCNFTYGIYTDIEKEWLDGCVAACDRAGFDYRITQHHADQLDLTDYNLSDQPIHDVLRGCTVFVSRFSTCMLESMALGKPVIYHNPHGEKMDAFQEPMGAFPITRNADELETGLRASLDQVGKYRETCDRFFRYHVSVEEKSSAERTAEALLAIPERERVERRLVPFTLFRLRSLAERVRNKLRS
jgi:hypothetical protein